MTDDNEAPLYGLTEEHQAVAVGARAVWFQLGVIDRAAFERTVAAGVPMVMDTCPAMEWRRRESARRA